MPRETLHGASAQGAAAAEHADAEDKPASQLPPLKPLIEDSEKRWTFKPSGSTDSLDALDPRLVLELLEKIQKHIRRSHLLVDQSTVVTVEQIHDLEQQCAHTVVAFTRLIAASNQEMELIGRAAGWACLAGPFEYALTGCSLNRRAERRDEQGVQPHPGAGGADH